MNGTVRRRQSGDWEYRFDAGFDSLTGRRRRPGRSGFATKKEATHAMRKAIADHDRGRSVKSTSRTVEDFLREWHLSVRSTLRPTTWVHYRDYMNAYVIPVIGGTKLQDLTPMRLNLLYGHLSSMDA